MQRLYYFDDIKIILILVVIFIHPGLAYVPTAEGWSPSFPGPRPFADVPSLGTNSARGFPGFSPFSRLHFPIQKQLSLIHISEPTRRTPISYAVFCLKK